MRWHIARAVVVVLLWTLVLPATATATEFDAGCELTGAVSRLNEGPTNYDTLNLRPSGTATAVMLFVDFPDAPANESTSAYESELVPDAEAYFTESSYGQLDLQVATIPKWYRMPSSASSYGFSRGLTFYEHRAYIEDAIALADAEVDFSAYDLIYVTAVRTPSISYSPAFLANPGFGVVVDGEEKRLGATFGYDIWTVGWRWRVLVHETGHVFGLPDLYDFAASDNASGQHFAGRWDPMASVHPGVHFLAWHKVKLGWLDATQMECVSTPETIEATISPVSTTGGSKLIAVRTSPATAYVAEVRERSGADANLCDDGVLVYSVDAATKDGFGPVRIHPADASVGFCGPLSHAPFDTQVPVFEDANVGVRFEILPQNPDGSYRIRATYTGTYVGPDTPIDAHSPVVSLKMRRHLVAAGAVTDGYDGCFAGVVVTIERKTRTSFVAAKSARTSSTGAFRVKLPDKTGTYRATIAPAEPLPGHHACAGAESPTRRHRH